MSPAQASSTREWAGVQGAHVLVTGGGSGIGAAIARALAAEGARITVAGRRAEPLQQVLSDLPTCEGDAAPGASHGHVVMDITDEDSVKAGFEQARAARGPIAVLVNNAGAAESSPFLRTDLTLWQRMMDVNLTGAYLCTHAALPDLLAAGSGRIVNVASTAGLKGYAYVVAYTAAKHGVVGLTRALAVELARKGITVNAVCPGFTDTGLLERSVALVVDKTGRSRDETRDELASVNPQGRLIQPEEVADTVRWLCSPAAASITGQAISISGGEVM